MTACTVVIPTRDRPELVWDAVDSALEQTGTDVAVLVVDDGSRSSVRLPDDPRLTVVRHLRPRGVSAARNLGLSLATTPFVTFLDDDDRLRPSMVARSLEMIGRADAPRPVAALSAIAVVDEAGQVLEVRVPPARRSRGDHLSLEPIEPGRSYFTKQTLVVERNVLLDIGGFDERLRSRVVTEMFWRLNAVCSLVGLEDVTYELRSHTGPRLSTDRRLRQASFEQLLATHRTLLAAHPDGYAELLAQHARTSLATRQPVAALRSVVRHARVAPRRTVHGLLRALRS